jgi:hypothetical protein
MTLRLRTGLLLGALGFGAAAAPASAQVLGGLAYTWSNPAGDFDKQFLSNDSWIGISVVGQRFLRENTTVGVRLGYNAFYQRTTDPLVLPTGTVTADQYRSMNIFPVLVTGTLYSKAPGRIQTYIGLGVGVYYMRQMLEVGTASLTTSNLIFGFAPELGFILNRGARTEVAVFGQYNYPLNAGNFLGDQSGSYQYLSVGLSFMGRR